MQSRRESKPQSKRRPNDYHSATSDTGLSRRNYDNMTCYSSRVKQGVQRTATPHSTSCMRAVQKGRLWDSRRGHAAPRDVMHWLHLTAVATTCEPRYVHKCWGFGPRYQLFVKSLAKSMIYCPLRTHTPSICYSPYYLKNFIISYFDFLRNLGPHYSASHSLRTSSWEQLF